MLPRLAAACTIAFALTAAVIARDAIDYVLFTGLILGMWFGVALAWWADRYA